MSVDKTCELLFFIAVIIYSIATYHHDKKLEKYSRLLEENNTSLRILLGKTANLASSLKNSYLTDVSTLLDEMNKGRTREDGNQSGNRKSSARGNTGNSNSKK